MPRGGDLHARWSQEVRRSGWLRAGERIGVAVSGGADSVLLLAFMKQLAQPMGLIVSVVHFNHHLRGEESDADEKFVQDLASVMGVEFLRGEAHVARVARESRRNLENVARELRYRFFFSLINRGLLDTVVTAHTANDQAETVLLRLLRGTGTRGLGGIFPSLEGKILRPFLNLTRAEIEAELARRKLAFRTDSSNRDARLRRNKIRMELLPPLAKEFNPDVVILLKDLASRARDDEEFLEQQARERAQAWRVRDGHEEKIPARPLADFPKALSRRIIRHMILAVRGSLLGITHRHIDAVLHLAAEAQSGRHVVLPGKLRARREFEWVVIGREAPAIATSDYAYPVHPPSEVSIPALGARFHFKIVGVSGGGEAYNQDGCVCLDAAKLQGETLVRNWRPGDRFQPAGSRKSQKLKELFRQQRIVVAKRSLWPVVENGNTLVWVRGLPVAAHVAPTPETTRVLVISESASTADLKHRKER